MVNRTRVINIVGIKPFLAASIAETRHITTTAEGVEKQQREILRALGCAQMQGYLFSSAKLATEIRRLLLANHDKAVA